MTSKLIGPSRRRKRPKPEPPGPSAQNMRSDARAEEELRALGGDPTLATPAGMTLAQKELEEIEQYIAGDATLARQPQVRKFLREVYAEEVCMLDGSPLMIGKDGEKKQIRGSFWKVLFRAGMLKAIQGDEAWAERIWNTIYGKSRESMELSGPGGGAIPTVTRHEGLSAEQLAERYVRAARIAQAVLERDKASTEVEVIEVGASAVSPSAVTSEAVMVPTTAQLETIGQPPSRPAQHPQVSPGAPVGQGMIPRR